MIENFLDTSVSESPSVGEAPAAPAPSKKKGKSETAEASAAPTPTAVAPTPLLSLEPKPLGNTNMDEARASMSDLQVHGDPGAWVCIAKASSEKQGWMKSTKVLDLGQFGCLIQVSTEKRNPDGSTSLAEALEYVPGMRRIQIPGQAPKPQAAPGSVLGKK